MFSLFQGDVLRLGLRYIVSSVVDSCSFQGMVQHLWISWRLHHWIVLPVRMTTWHDMSFWCHVLSYFDFQIGWWWTHDSLATSHQISMVQWRRCRAVVSVQDFIYASFNGVIIGNFRNCLVSDKATYLQLLTLKYKLLLFIFSGFFSPKDTYPKNGIFSNASRRQFSSRAVSCIQWIRVEVVQRNIPMTKMAIVVWLLLR